MRCAAIAAAAFLLCAGPLRADTIRLSNNGRMQGSLQELLLRVDGIPRAYARDQLRAAALSNEGDAVELANGTKVRGHVISMTFKCAGKVYAFGRSKLRAVALDGAASAVEQTAAPAPAGDPVPRARPLTPDELAAKKRSLDRCQTLCRKFLAKARRPGPPGSASRGEDRAKRILAMAEQIKLEVRGGRFLTDGQMFLRYQAALEGKPFSEPTRTQLRSMDNGVRIIRGTSDDTPELVVEPFPEMKY